MTTMQSPNEPGILAGYLRDHRTRLLFRVDGYDVFDHTRLLVELSGRIRGQLKESELIDLQPLQPEDHLVLSRPRSAGLPSGDWQWLGWDGPILRYWQPGEMGR